MYKNDLILRVLRGEKVERPPVWMMRQAGRILPQYRAVRESLSGFVELVKSPDLVSEVTIQPVDALDVDAAIIFSDILVIPEAMGLPYELIEQKGPFFPETIKNRKQIDALITGQDAASHLEYVYEGVRKTKKDLAGRVPLIGFAGAPFTLLCYMVEGRGSKTFSAAKKFLYAQTEDAHQLLAKITDAIIAYLQQKIESGVDVIQIFDSWAGSLDKQTYKEFCIPYLKKIVDAIQPKVPVILFSKGAWFSLEELDACGSTAIGIDWNTDPAFARSLVSNGKILQGNLDPCVLYASPSFIETKTKDMIDGFGTNYIANLGHGVYPDTSLEGVYAFINTVKNYKYQN
jgi:uroporphyrinogen decarboxylase